MESFVVVVVICISFKDMVNIEKEPDFKEDK